MNNITHDSAWRVTRAHSRATNEALNIIDGVGGVDSGLVLGSISNQALSVSERDV